MRFTSRYIGEYGYKDDYVIDVGHSDNPYSRWTFDLLLRLGISPLRWHCALTFEMSLVNVEKILDDVRE